MMTLALLFSTAFFAKGKEIVINQKQKKFSVTEVKAKLGDTLIFKNEDTFQHNVYSFSKNNAFELKTQNPGQSSPVKLDPANHKVGEMIVECAIHPKMKLKVTIEK